MFLNILFKYAFIFSLIGIFIKIKYYFISNSYYYAINNEITELNNYSISLNIQNITNISKIYFIIENITYYYSQKFQLIEVKYYIKLKDENNIKIKPSDLFLFYNLHMICNLYIIDNDENIYSIANIYENQCFFCIEYINFNEKSKFGIRVYKNNEINEEIENFQHYYI